jgi:hypothetical protein
MLTLPLSADELARPLPVADLPDAGAARPCHWAVGRYRDDPNWRELVLFHEYFHGEHGTGLGASHQTGWTALVATLLEGLGRSRAERAVTPRATKRKAAAR